MFIYLMIVVYFFFYPTLIHSILFLKNVGEDQGVSHPDNKAKKTAEEKQRFFD